MFSDTPVVGLFKNFQQLLKQVLSVPKEKIDEKRAEYGREKKEKRSGLIKALAQQPTTQGSIVRPCLLARICLLAAAPA